jgi:hypothetical protein
MEVRPRLPAPGATPHVWSASHPAPLFARRVAARIPTVAWTIQRYRKPSKVNVRLSRLESGGLGGRKGVRANGVGVLLAGACLQAARRALVVGSGTGSPLAQQAAIQARVASPISWTAASGVVPNAEQPGRSGTTAPASHTSRGIEVRPRLPAPGATRPCRVNLPPRPRSPGDSRHRFPRSHGPSKDIVNRQRLMSG